MDELNATNGVMRLINDNLTRNGGILDYSNYSGVINDVIPKYGIAATSTPQSFKIPSISEKWDMSNAFDSMYGIGNDATNSAIAKGNVAMGPTVQNADLLKGKEPGTDWGMDGMGGVALGAGKLGLGLLGYLDNKKTAKLQRNLLQQQYDTNASELAHSQLARAAAEGGFNIDKSKVPVLS